MSARFSLGLGLLLTILTGRGSGREIWEEEVTLQVPAGHGSYAAVLRLAGTPSIYGWPQVGPEGNADVVLQGSMDADCARVAYSVEIACAPTLEGWLVVVRVACPPADAPQTAWSMLLDRRPDRIRIRGAAVLAVGFA